jgi:hypothetical protein
MDCDDQVATADFSAVPPADRAPEVGLLCNAMEAAAGDLRSPDEPLLGVTAPEA